MANRILRDQMRGPRKKAKEQALQDQVLLKKASLDIKLLPETEQDKKMASLLKLNSSMSSEQKESELREEIIEESKVALNEEAKVEPDEEEQVEEV